MTENQNNSKTKEIEFKFKKMTIKAKVPVECQKFLYIIDRLTKIQPTGDLKEIEQIASATIIERWQKSLFWVFKKEARLRIADFKILETAEYKAVRPLGDFFISLLDLAEDVLDFTDMLRLKKVLKTEFRNYDNAYDWFYLLCLSQELAEIYSSTVNNRHQRKKIKFLSPQDGEIVYENHHPNRVIAFFNATPNRKIKEERMRNEINKLKTYENPYSLDSHIGILIELSIAILQSQFKDREIKEATKKFKEVWKRYLDSYQKILNNVHSGKFSPTLKVKDDKVIKISKGKQIKVYIQLKTPKGFRKSRSKPK